MRKPVADRYCFGEDAKKGGPCFGKLKLDEDWEPEGLDPKMRRFVCHINSEHVLYIVIGPKEIHNLRPEATPVSLPGFGD